MSPSLGLHACHPARAGQVQGSGWRGDKGRWVVFYGVLALAMSQEEETPIFSLSHSHFLGRMDGQAPSVIGTLLVAEAPELAAATHPGSGTSLTTAEMPPLWNS